MFPLAISKYQAQCLEISIEFLGDFNARARFHLLDRENFPPSP